MVNDKYVKNMEKQVEILMTVMKKVAQISMMNKDNEEEINLMRAEINESMKPLIYKNKELNWPRNRKSLNVYTLNILGKILRRL